MKQGMVKYSQEFIMPNGLKRWLGVEYPVDFDRDEDAHEAFTKAEAMVNGYNKPSEFSDIIPEVQVGNHNPYSATGDLATDIKSCKTIKMIDEYRLIVNAKGFEWAKDVWTTRRAELVKEESDAIIAAANSLCKKG
jgi:hypothetical protein